MKPTRTIFMEVFAAVLISAAATSLSDTVFQASRTQPAPVQLAQEDYAEPIGEEDGPVGGAMVGGGPVEEGQDAEPIGGAMVGGAPVEEGVEAQPIEGEMVDGAPVEEGQDAEPIGGAMVGGAPVEEGEDAEPIEGDTLY